MSSVKAACILFLGPVLTFRAFKQSATRSMRGIADAEFQEAISLLEIAGRGTLIELECHVHLILSLHLLRKIQTKSTGHAIYVHSQSIDRDTICRHTAVSQLQLSEN